MTHVKSFPLPRRLPLGSFNPFSDDPLPAYPKKQLVLKIISGQQLPKPPDSMLGDRGEVQTHRNAQNRHSVSAFLRHIAASLLNTPLTGNRTASLSRQIIDPFVEVEIIGLPVDCCKEQTRVVDDNG